MVQYQNSGIGSVEKNFNQYPAITTVHGVPPAVPNWAFTLIMCSQLKLKGKARNKTKYFSDLDKLIAQPAEMLLLKKVYFSTSHVHSVLFGC